METARLEIENRKAKQRIVYGARTLHDNRYVRGKKRGGKEGKDVEGRRNIGNHTRKSGSGEFGPANWYSISIWGHPSSSGRGGPACGMYERLRCPGRVYWRGKRAASRNDRSQLAERECAGPSSRCDMFSGHRAEEATDLRCPNACRVGGDVDRRGHGDGGRTIGQLVRMK